MTIPSQGRRTVETKLAHSPRSGADLVRVGGDFLGLCASDETMHKPDIPKAYCACDCGQVIDAIDKKGRPKSYARGHNRNCLSAPLPRRLYIDLFNPKCQCGCGQSVSLDHGIPMRFANGHGSRGHNNPSWRGGERIISEKGRRMIWVGTGHHLAGKSGYAVRARVVAEKELGRKLVSTEVVHHLNGDQSDDRPHNLAVLEGQSEHCRIHKPRLGTGNAYREWRLP